MKVVCQGSPETHSQQVHTRGLSRVRPRDCSPSDSSAHGLSRQEDWSRLPLHAPGVLPGPGIEPAYQGSFIAGGFLPWGQTLY